MAKNDNVFVTTEIFSLTEWNNDSNSKNLSARLLNNNGFIIFFQEQNQGKGAYWNNKGNFWCRQDDMPILARMIELVVRDIKEGNYSRERYMKGSKSDFYILAKEKNGRLYIAAKLVPKDSNGNQDDSKALLIKFPSNKVLDDEQTKGLILLETFRDAIKNTYDRVNTSFDSHYKKYFEEINGSSGGSKSGGSSKGKSSGGKEDIESDDDYPF
jgi:hypothetical protein